MDKTLQNPLVSMAQSTSGLQVVLHPLVLLSISDYITRHSMRSQKGPIVCGLVGQTHGREITIEHAFDCQLYITPEGDHILHEDWFASRLDQMKQVHTDRELDIVGWSTILPQSGPEPSILPLHNQILSKFNESSVLLAFHAELIAGHSGGGKLPLTIYESHYEVEGAAAAATNDDGEDQTMKDSGDAGGVIKLKFSELPYSVEMGEAEVISMDTVARTAVAASAVADRPANSGAGDNSSKASGSTAKAVAVEGKGKKRIVAGHSEDTASGIGTGGKSGAAEVTLSGEDEEMISSLTTKANAVKMLHSRIKLLLSYLEQLPPDFASGDKAGVITDEMKAQPQQYQGQSTTTTVPDYTILRSIQALVNRLPLVVPSDEKSFSQEIQRETNDVKLIGLLREVIDQTTMAKNMGRKAHIVDSARLKSNRGAASGLQDFAGAAGSMGGGYNSHSAGDLMGV
ncbi:uncharacterized protein MKZ38_008509 [Zalerion maritima]|uniref:COP9 signalosome complex subunit 6 n=1 Tax=Zalerion maritima TaxID=339359 RepID=A0AAD5WP31_9PEZI|nr:uncharacterized protein MKZ38_008509 [Zalerion maritima]